MASLPWTPVKECEPIGRLLLLKTPYGVFVHSMLNKAGELVPWDKQEEHWTGGRFDYCDVTGWVAIE